VQGKCLSEEVLPHTSHLHSELCVPRSSVGVGGAEEADGVVPFLENQHTDNFLVAIDNEVPSELVLVFCQFDQLFGSQFVEVTVLGTHHDGDLSQISCECVDIVVDLSSDLSNQRSRICLAGQSALLRVNLLMNGSRVIEPVRLS
jgi:hypothetical protein